MNELFFFGAYLLMVLCGLGTAESPAPPLSGIRPVWSNLGAWEVF